MTHQEPDIDALLREAFDGSVPDDGFTDRLMARVPECRRSKTWPLIVGVVAGVACCWLNLGSVPVLRFAWREWLSGQWSMPVITLLAVAMGMSLLALVWMLGEAEDR